MCRDANLSSDMINHIRNREELIGTGFGAYRVTFRRTTTSLLLIESPYQIGTIALVPSDCPRGNDGTIESGRGGRGFEFDYEIFHQRIQRVYDTYNDICARFSETDSNCWNMRADIYVSYLCFLSSRGW